jgi:hypothetical protein
LIDEYTGWFKLDIHEGKVETVTEDGKEVSSGTHYYKLWFGFKNWATEGMKTYTSKRSTSDWTGWYGQIGFNDVKMFEKQPWFNCVLLNYGSS